MYGFDTCIIIVSEFHETVSRIEHSLFLEPCIRCIRRISQSQFVIYWKVHLPVAEIFIGNTERDLLTKVESWPCVVIPLMYFGVIINFLVQQFCIDFGPCSFVMQEKNVNKTQCNNHFILSFFHIFQMGKYNR